jgi:hypothetical protein
MKIGKISKFFYLILGAMVGYVTAALTVSHSWWIDMNSGKTKKEISIFPCTIKLDSSSSFEDYFSPYSYSDDGPNWLLVERKRLYNPIRKNGLGARLIQAQSLLVESDRLYVFHDQKRSAIGDRFFKILKEEGVDAGYEYANEVYLKSDDHDPGATHPLPSDQNPLGSEGVESGQLRQ